MKRMLKGAISVVAFAATLAAGSAVAAEKIKFGMNAPQGDNPEWNALLAFKNHVEYKTEGAITVDLFPSAQLGAERACAEQVQQGAVEVCLVDTGALAGFYEDIQVLSIPYLFKSSVHAWSVFDSPFFGELAEDMRKETGIRVMSWGENGFRDFTNNVHPIRTPEDLKGLKMRVMESPVFIRFVESFGAAATPMPGSEIIMAAKQGVIDGQENPAQVNYDYNLMDVQKYMSTDEHILGVHAYIISDTFFEGLTDDQKAIVLEAATLAARVENTQKLAGAKKYIDLIREKGVEVHMTTMAEKDAFAAVSQEPVLEYLREQVGAELVQSLLETAKEHEAALYGR
ncbi:DctP family TRAP transporter solute-binding subunit [Roseibium salinum]|uniref:DctP family TRAP transporter solute-binding subunit n=1 Tax=Roseibium salinum TaxID=1604349 RepID=A0ABT3QW60_9HYPH|nr:DctP family TRAP transporter solute-binding subunit [Roseibium sp. DSM 29163]MCX2721161.1 DctP family TRAP transporter solute-binding subunit [Roseibium sp. DSM 29163]